MGTIRRLAITTPLDLLHRPADAALRFVPGSEGLRTSLDRIDFTVRGAAGWLFRDEQLTEDAQRRRQALELRTQAELQRQQAEKKLREETTQAQQLREQADENADERRIRAEQQRKREQQRAKSTAAQRKQETKKLATEVIDEIENEAKADRLEVLEAKTEALDLTEQALRTEEEAGRLAEATARTKAARKQS